MGAWKLDISCRKWRFSQFSALWKCSMERVKSSRTIGGYRDVCSARKTLFDIVASLFWDFAISKPWNLWPFHFRFRAVKIIWSRFFCKINSFYRHKQFKFLIFTKKNRFEGEIYAWKVQWMSKGLYVESDGFCAFAKAPSSRVTFRRF